MKHSGILLILALLASLTACKRQPAPDEAPAPQGIPVTVAFKDTVEIPLVRIDNPASKTKNTSKTSPTSKTRNTSSTRNTSPTRNTRNSSPETIYVETDGAQGRVWGHVTLRGDRGTGTIHDWDENTLTVSVTRHGNELFAVDQNSRQYVFKLKQNKQQ